MGNETNLSCNITHFTREQIMHFQDYKWWVETIGNLCCGAIGVFLNSITIHIFSSPSLRKNFFNRLLICLAIFDILYISCEISEVFRHRHNTFLQQSIFVNFVYPIRNVFMFSSVYMTLVLAFERLQAITDPMKFRIRGVRTSINQELCTHVLPGVIFAVIYYLPKFFELEVGRIRKQCNHFDNMTSISINGTAEEAINMGATGICTSKYIVVPTNLRRNHVYVFWYIIVSNLTLTALIPLCVLTFLNGKIILSLKKISKNKQSLKASNSPTKSDLPITTNNCLNPSHLATDVKKTFILFSIVVLFAVCHSLRVAFNIDEFIFRMRQITNNEGCCYSRIWTKYVGPFNQLFIILNSSLNFFIYALFDCGFQQVLRERLKMNFNEEDNKNINREKRRSTLHTDIIANNAIELSNLNINKV